MQYATIDTPECFAVGIMARYGEAGRHWLDLLPDILAQCCAAWDLTLTGPAMHGNCAVVLPVRRPGEAAVLKITWLDDKTRHEAVALRHWNGNGAVRLLAHDPTVGALLLERLDSDRPLERAGVETATQVAAELLRRLAIPICADSSASPEQAGMCEVSAQAGRWAEDLETTWRRVGRPMPRRWLDAALDACRQLVPSAARLLVNQDLHYANVLAAQREPWLVIDPKVVVGDPEFGIGPLLWNRFTELDGPAAFARRFDAVVAVAGLDAERAAGWSVFRVVDYWLWASAGGSDTSACAAIARWLIDGD
jgi:streptomycin 6-kinase